MVSRNTVVLVLLAMGLILPIAEARRFGGGSTHGHSSPHATEVHPHGNAESGISIRPHISGSSNEEDNSDGGSGSSINSGYVMLGLAGPLLFIAFRLRKFFRLRRDKHNREGEFAEMMLAEHARNPAPAPHAFTSTATTAAPLVPPVAPPAIARLADGGDIDAFIRQGRASFLHLRTLNQAMNGEEIRNYLTPALLERLRPTLPKNAEAVKFPILKVELLESYENTGSFHALLRFFGTVRPSASGPVFEFAETWHFRKANAIENWLVEDIIRDDNPSLN